MENPIRKELFCRGSFELPYNDGAQVVIAEPDFRYDSRPQASPLRQSRCVARRMGSARTRRGIGDVSASKNQSAF